jgi:hypothetical protein
MFRIYVYKLTLGILRGKVFILRIYVYKLTLGILRGKVFNIKGLLRMKFIVKLIPLLKPCLLKQ